MTQILKGAPAAAALTERAAAISEELQKAGVMPTLAIVRVGAREDDLSYERGAGKRCEKAGIAVKNVVMPADVTPEVFEKTLADVAADPAVHGILLFRPLPKHLDEARACAMIPPEKDVDGCTELSLAGVFTGSGRGFAPCTARAVMEVLAHYGVELSGKRAAVIGRSLVIGRPVGQLLMRANATVTTCHTRTQDVPAITREADIVVCASGVMESVGKDYLAPGQTVIDVGIGWNEEKQKLCGDLRAEEADGLVAAYTPVPGGVGAVTTAVLALQTAEAARRQTA